MFLSQKHRKTLDLETKDVIEDLEFLASSQNVLVSVGIRTSDFRVPRGITWVRKGDMDLRETRGDTDGPTHGRAFLNEGRGTDTRLVVIV